MNSLNILNTNLKNFVNELTPIVEASNIRLSEPMKNHTSFKVGGPADILVTPSNIHQLQCIIPLCNEKNIKYFIMGNGTNIVVKDSGIRGVVIKLQNSFNQCTITNDIIEAYAGTLVSYIANIALMHELSGAEFLSGIPGTIGGAITMNAGAYGYEIRNIVLKTQYMDENGKIITIENSQHRFGYRTSLVQQERGIVLKSKLKLIRSDKSQIKSLMNELNSKRRQKQPLNKPSAGSVFKRPEGYFTGKLIEDCGLKGYRIGGAEVSTKHSGFIINSGGATASDIIALINHIQQAVFEKYGVKLQPELKIVGE